MPFELIPVYITQVPNDKFIGPPNRSEVQLDLSEGPHLGYAIQWFTFALILASIYFIYVGREEKKSDLIKIIDNPKSQVDDRILGNHNVR
jgi:cytochrome oxidase assembly protein ShyY1